jgi:uncharacterized glyoxalase superfamily metalloenzyme YdcJ
MSGFHGAFEHAAGFAVMARHFILLRFLRGVMYSRRMLAMRQAAHAAALRRVPVRSARHQGQRRSEQGEDYEDGLSAAHPEYANTFQCHDEAGIIALEKTSA